MLKRSMAGTPFDHYAVYVGYGYVIHFNGDTIVKEKVGTFSCGNEVTKKRYCSTCLLYLRFYIMNICISVIPISWQETI